MKTFYQRTVAENLVGQLAWYTLSEVRIAENPLNTSIIPMPGFFRPYIVFPYREVQRSSQ